MRTSAIALTLALAASLCAACAPLAQQSDPPDAGPPAIDLVALVEQAPSTEPAFGQWLSEQRQRVRTLREQAEQRFKSDEQACWQRFAVNDCVHDARVRRRAVMESVRLQDLALNDLERQRRTADRLRALEEKQRQRP